MYSTRSRMALMEVPQNFTETARWPWYRLAADQGDATAQCILGLMYC